jgi:ATP-dependent DNA ligase
MRDPEPMMEPPIDGMRPAHDPSATPAVCSHGSAAGRFHSRGGGVALRTEMGRISLPCVSRRRQSRAAVEITPLDKPLFSGIDGSAWQAQAEDIRARRRDRCAHRRCAFSFDALLQRIHPAQSRIRKLAAETPALLIVFDLLVDTAGELLTEKTLDERRRALAVFYQKYCRGSPSIRLSPSSTRLAEAKGWLRRTGATLDGVIAKRRDFNYRAGNRSGMQKIKNFRSADCVVGGFRYNENSPLVGSLLLGLYDRRGQLNHVGFTSTIKREDKPTLTKKLKSLAGAPGFTGNAPGGPSRWATKRAGEWVPLKPKLVVEVCYDHFTGERFRHGTRLLRWRPDKAPRQCTIDQIKQKKAKLMALLD